MKSVMIKNISKISFLNGKIETIDNLISSGSYKDAYKAAAALLESKEKDISGILTEINGEYNLINYEKVKRRDVEFLIGYLDDIVGIIIEKHGNIF